MLRPHVMRALFRVWSNAHVLPAQKMKGLKLNGKQAHLAGGIKSELAILHHISNGTLDVA